LAYVLPGCSSVWLERLLWEQEVAGSSPVTPTAVSNESIRACPVASGPIQDSPPGLSAVSARCDSSTAAVHRPRPFPQAKTEFPKKGRRYTRVFPATRAKKLLFSGQKLASQPVEREPSPIARRKVLVWAGTRKSGGDANITCLRAFIMACDLQNHRSKGLSKRQSGQVGIFLRNSETLREDTVMFWP
jgi:hypothetical protein